jgi:RNA polymerase sigma-70 factor (ECF subfamily)
MLAQRGEGGKSVTAAGSEPRAWHAGLSDDEIVRRVRGGDAAAYEILMRRHNQRIYRAVRAILPDESDVEDVMQEAYLAAFLHLGGFAGRSRFSTWLVRIAVNQAIDRLRRSGRSLSFDPLKEEALPRESGASVAPGARDPEQQAGDRELGRRLEAAIQALPAPYRAAYVLRELERMEARDAAEALGIEEGTVKTRVHRARRLLREALGRDLGAAAADVFRFGGERCDRVVAAVLERVR